MNGHRRFAPAAVLLALMVPCFADEKDDRIDRLERETAELRREMAAMKAGRVAPSDVSAIRAAVDDYLSKNSDATGSYAGPGGVRRPGGNITLGGYFSTRWLAAEANGKHSFVDMRLVPQIHAQITDRIAFDTEIEFEHGGISDEIEGEIAVEYAELSFRASDAFKFKAGSLLVPFGWFNQNHDDPLNELSSRPDVTRFVMPAAYDSPGIGVEGVVEPFEDTAITYDVVVVNGLKDAIDGDEGIRGARGLFEEDDNHNKTVYGRVGFAPTLPFLDVLNIGASGAWGKIGEQADTYNGWGFDATAKHGPWEFKGEFDQFGIDRPSGSPPPIDAAGNLGPTRGLNGWYAQLLYRITDPWVLCMPFAEKDASVSMIVRRDRVDLNDRVHGAGEYDDERAWSFGVNYRPTTKTVVKLEYRTATSGAAGDLGEDRDLFVVEFATYF